MTLNDRNTGVPGELHKASWVAQPRDFYQNVQKLTADMKKDIVEVLHLNSLSSNW